MVVADMTGDENVSRRDVLARLAVGTTVASGMAKGRDARKQIPASNTEYSRATFADQGNQTGLYGGEYVLERYDEYVQVMPVNVILLTDRSVDEIWRTLRSAGWTTLTGSSLSGYPKYARNASGEPVQAELDVADETWNFQARQRRTHASLWKFHEGDDERQNVSIAAHVDVGTPIEMKFDAKFSDLIRNPPAAVSPGHRGLQFDLARNQLVELFIANGWEEVGQVQYAADHENEGHWRDHDGFATVLEPSDSAGTDASGFPCSIETGSATADGKTVTFTGTVTAPSGRVTVGFAWQDDNLMWGETDEETFAPEGTREFSITAEVPRTAFEYPYYAWAVFHDHGDVRYRGELREVLVPDFSDTVEIETVGVDTGSKSATIRGRVAAFGEASEVPVGAEVSEDGGIWRGVSRETKTPADDPAFAVEVRDLEPGTEYLGRAFGEVTSGPGSVKVTGEELSFATESETEDGEVTVETDDAIPDAETPRYVTFTGRIDGLSADATAQVGFEYQDYNAMWGETATEEVSEPGETEFTITEKMPYVGREFPYRAIATVEGPSGTERYVGETRSVAVPNFIDTIAVETVDVTVSKTTATVRGRVADFGKAETVLANAEVWRPGSSTRTSRTERVRLSTDGSPKFEIRFTDLEPDADYRARTLAEIPVGPIYATTYGNEVAFTTGGGDSGTEESTTTTTTEEPTTTTTEEPSVSEESESTTTK